MIIPAVSVIIPVYNQEKFIGRCIRSILNQTMDRSEYEIIVINDGSDDKTSFALDLFGDEITLIENNEKLGLPTCLNSGIQAARGQYLVRLDSDDYVSAEYLSILSLFLKSNPNMDAVACDYILVDDRETFLTRMNCLSDPIACGIMFRIEQLIDIGLYDPSFTFQEDMDLRIRFSKKYQIHRIELPLYRYRRHENNMTNNLDEMKRFENEVKNKHGIS